jgi:hypothetical protein
MRFLWRSSELSASPVDSPQDLAITAMGSSDWTNEFEQRSAFQVLDRYTATIPTDGVDFEEVVARCLQDTPAQQAEEKERGARGARAALVEALGARVTAGEGMIRINVDAGKPD